MTQDLAKVPFPAVFRGLRRRRGKRAAAQPALDKRGGQRRKQAHARNKVGDIGGDQVGQFGLTLRGGDHHNRR